MLWIEDGIVRFALEPSEGCAPTHRAPHVMMRAPHGDGDQKGSQAGLSAEALCCARQGNEHLVHQIFRCGRVAQQAQCERAYGRVMRVVRLSHRVWLGTREPFDEQKLGVLEALLERGRRSKQDIRHAKRPASFVPRVAQAVQSRPIFLYLTEIVRRTRCRP
jgi:hypothetical protein